MNQKRKRKDTSIHPNFLIADGLINPRRKYQEGNKHDELCENERPERTVITKVYNNVSTKGGCIMEKLLLLIAFILFSLFLGIVLAKLGGFALSKMIKRKHYK